MKYVICTQCDWIHIAKSEEEIKEHLEGFQTYIDSLDQNKKIRTLKKVFLLKNL